MHNAKERQPVGKPSGKQENTTKSALKKQEEQIYTGFIRVP
jgi:hypothetical protein